MNIIKHPDFGEIRTIIRKGEPWFVAQDVCVTLGLNNQHDSGVRNLDDDERGVGKIPTPGGSQEMTVINESGMYSVIIRSNKPAAKKFRKWVTSEVLPSIRRDGYYCHPDFMTPALLRKQKRQLSKSILTYLNEDDLRKVAKRFGCQRYNILSVLEGNSTNNAIMQECQARAMVNKKNELNAYHPDRISEVIKILSR